MELSILKFSTYKKRIIKDMKAVGTYKPEFLQTINELAKMLEDMDKARGEFEADGSRIIVEHTNKNGSTNLAKNPLYLAMEGMQARILAYHKELGLTPTGLKKIKGDDLNSGSKNELVEVLSRFG